MKDTSKWMIALMCAVFIASPALGSVVYYGGTGANSQGAPGSVTGGAYYDNTITPTEYRSEYGVDAHVETAGVGTSTSQWTHAATIVQTPTVGGNPYNVVLSYGGPGGQASVYATATQKDDDGSMHADAGVNSYADIQDDGAGTQVIYGDGVIYSGVAVKTHGTALASATGVAAYDISNAKTTDEVWGAVSGTTSSSARIDGPFDTVSHDASDWGKASPYNYIWAASDSNVAKDFYAAGQDQYYSDAYAALYGDIYNDQNGQDPTYQSANSAVQGQASAGAWDRETPSTLIKQHGMNENAYATSQGTATSEAITNLYHDQANSVFDQEMYAYNSYNSLTGPVDLYAAFGFVVTGAEVYRDLFPIDNQRATADAFITNGNIKAVAQSTGLPFVASVSSSNINLGSGAHALNPTGGDYWFSEAGSFVPVTYAEYKPTASSPSYTQLYLYTYTYGPQVGISGTSADDAGSLMQIQNTNLQATSVAQSTNNINFINWIEGSDLNTDMFPLVQNWVNTNTGPSHDEHYTRAIDNSDPTERYNVAEIYATTYN